MSQRTFLLSGGQLLIHQSIEMEEFRRNFVYKQVGHIITAEEYKCQVDLHQRRNLCENEEKAIFVLLSTRVNRYESKNFLLSGDQLLIDRSIEKEEFSTDFVASTGNYCRRYFYKEIGDILAEEEFKCQVQLSHRREKSVAKLREREICAERAQVACSYFLREKGEYGRKLLNIKRTRRGTMESYSSVGMILEAEWKFHCYRE
ncbi:hypothetical protein T4D_13361 [Trichinella pseudospiralis]|uniref:Uncharacterized protein n=1 Tax=Trichinella pseudospiralis TaxID=6337 RepID=A0A0V1F3Z9_TRIPS|nr:hypothetical protein T4D_13361 [Trichinella pseudospiralis]